MLSKIVRRVVSSFLEHWNQDCGYKNILLLAFPLILSTATWSIQHFVDRMLLLWYSTSAVAASMPAGSINLATMATFIGTASYVNTFVAQYYGANRLIRIGPSMWQGIYVALAGALLHLILIPLAVPLFSSVGHAPEIRNQEIIYFQTLCLGAFPVIATSAFSSFFSGRGRPWPIMWISFFQTGVNILFDYLLIFGRMGLPEMGIKGAALATVISAYSALGCYSILLFRPSYAKTFNLLHGWRFNPKMFSRLVRFGFPAGVQFFMDMSGFTIFLLLIGRLGSIALAATTIALNIGMFAFMPMIGIGIAISTLVGQRLGMNKPALAQRSVWSGFHFSALYMGSIALLFLLVPNIFLSPFLAKASSEDLPLLYPLTITLLRFVGFYSFFDVLTVVFSAALRGAGDTRFIMWAISILSLLILAGGSFVILILLRGGIYGAWSLMTAYIILLGVTFLIRFLGGKWKDMRVIEPRFS